MNAAVSRETFTRRYAIAGTCCSSCGGDVDTPRGWYCRACRALYMRIWRAKAKRKAA